MASEKLGVQQTDITFSDGSATTADPTIKVSYGDLIGDQVFNRTISENVALKDPALYTIVGQSVPRLDLPGKMFGTPSYVADFRVPGMLHGRTLHPASIGATVTNVDEGSVSGISDLVKVVRNGDFVGVVAGSEWGAIQAAGQLNVTWNSPDTLPDQARLADWIRQQSTSDKQPVDSGDVDAVLNAASRVIQASFTQPYQN